MLILLVGPFGMFYSTVTGAVAMLLVYIFVGFFTYGIGLMFVWPVCFIWGVAATINHNKKLTQGAALSKNGL